MRVHKSSFDKVTEFPKLRHGEFPFVNSQSSKSSATSIYTETKAPV